MKNPSGGSAGALAGDLLERIGTADTLPALRREADRDDRSRAVRIEATAVLEAIQKRIGK